ncbi:MAG TPA: HAD-IC family P-type ATPase, partial [Candidatus Polarisedimenticolia bacterium]|nr:HAD-IC family P-type ATPase [Candidatus Polarisedimenticolia bacterium]
PDRFETIAGMGVEGTVAGRRVALGNEALFARLGCDVSPLASPAEGHRHQGRTVAFLSVDGVAAGLLAVADPIKESAADSVRRLREERIRIVMATGDGRATAQAVASRLGIDEVASGLLPEGKLDLIRRLQAAGRVVAMAGDGINDAPALAQADAGIAMGAGTDVAMKSASVTLVKGDLRGILIALRLSRATMRNIRQNLFFAFVYNAMGVPIAAGVLFPLTGLLLSPMLASAAMSFSSVSVIGNALRLRRMDLSQGSA